MPRTLPRTEFVALMAVLIATVAFSIDSMLPALPEMAAELTPDAVNRAQLVLTAFVFGMGVGTLIVGPLSDSFGRKPTITVGVAVYIAGAALAASAPTLETLLAARVLQGLGAAAPRIVSVALVRDLYEGRAMARIMSFVMMVFIIIPSLAPFLGALIIAEFGWRGIFGAFILFSLAGLVWLTVRQEETLPPSRRRPLSARALLDAFREVVRHPMVRIYIVVLTLGFGQMFAFISSIQQIMADIYGKVETFPAWFATIGLLSGTGTILNASLVMRFGMRRLAMLSYVVMTIVTTILLLVWLSGLLGDELPFAVFVAWAVLVFFITGLTFGNLNALALQPMGHVAGMAASVVGAVATVLAVAVAAPISLAFNGTLGPALTGTAVCSGLAWMLMRRTVEAAPEPGRSAAVGR